MGKFMEENEKEQVKMERNWKLEKLTVEELKTASEEDQLDFIRLKLAYDPNTFGLKVHRKFEMSGYGENCTSFNSAILNVFEYLGIYNFTKYLFLDFYKGTPTLYFKRWEDEEAFEINLDGYSTTEIILEIFKHTIFSEQKQRRR